jgi:hypothetical protein
MTVAAIEERAVLAEIMNKMFIWSFPACSTDEPPRRAPVIMPGIEIRPMTLFRYKNKDYVWKGGTKLDHLI